MKLPNGGHAELGTKLEDYVLNQRHRHGQHKAKMFEAVLGISAANKEILVRALLAAAATSNDVVSSGDNGYGQIYSIRFVLETPRARATILSAWIIRNNEDFPRLTTCFIV